MSGGENTNEKAVEKLAEALSEAIDETDTVKESTEIELKLDEDNSVEETATDTPAVEEASAEETPAEKTSAEETPAEETPAEETPAEETPAEEPEPATKKGKKTIIITLSIIAGAIAILLGAYLGISSYYKDKFLMGTSVNGVDCSGKTLKEVEAMLQKEVEEYSITIYKSDDTTEVIEGTAMDITYGGYKQLKESFDKQNAYTWPKSFFEEIKINAEIVFEYSTEKLDTIINELECMKVENQVAPVSATVVYNGKEYVIQNEVQGTQLDAAKVKEVIHAGVTAMDKSVDLDETGCYVQPVYFKDSEAVVSACKELNKYLSAKITYSLDNIQVIVDKEDIASWISIDANMTPIVDAAKVKAFTDTLGATYNTANRSGTITTPTGKEAAVAVVGYGRQVGSQADCNQLINEIKAGKTVTRSPIIAREATPEGQYAWGNTYVEVDITEQHMWYIVNGQVAFETDVVTGKLGQNDTPTGTYTILEKMRNKVLRGRPLANGKPSYLTPVSYWMRVTWSGIGFHDAGWQPTFGGDRYVNNGSHGCINMPPAKAAEFYGMLSVGCPVVIHH